MEAEFFLGTEGRKVKDARPLVLGLQLHPDDQLSTDEVPSSLSCPPGGFI